MTKNDCSGFKDKYIKIIINLYYWRYNIESCHSWQCHIMGKIVLWELGFCTQLKVRWYSFRLDCYNFIIITKVTTKKISIEYTQENWKRIKMCHYKISSNTKDNVNRLDSNQTTDRWIFKTIQL
jgi:hypothetical protein